jgi:prolipoprotein diacylglyceryltransferase
MQESINRDLDKLVRPEMRLLHRSRSVFQVCGYTGLALAVLVALTLATRMGLSLVIMGALINAAVLTFFGLVMATKIITREEQIIYYHHEIAVMGVAMLLLWLLHQPALPYVDVTILGLGVFLSSGRVGCFMVGCCHGRPYRWGVCYRQEHADAGFTPYYVDVRLFPIQLVESLWVLAVVIVGSYFIIRRDPPGTALAWYVVSYDLGRFFFEFMRGDPARPYACGFSQPQWISVILLWCVAVPEIVGALPLHRWHLAAAAALTLAMIAIAVKRRVDRIDRFHLFHPRHVKEIAEIINVIEPAGDPLPNWRWTVFDKPDSTHHKIRVGCTSQGVRVSASTIRLGRESIEHFALSHVDRGMTEEAARGLAQIILRLRKSDNAGRIFKGNASIFHVLIRQAA